MPPGDDSFVKATQTSFEVLGAVRELNGAGISEIARHLGRSKSGVYKHVVTLADGGYLVRQGDTYHVGLGMWALGAPVEARFPVEAGKRAVDSLAASVERRVSLVLYETGTAVVAYVNDPSETGSIDRSVGDVLPLHATAAGKAVLAYASSDERERALDGDVTAFTDRTTTDRAELRSELDAVRDRRAADERGEHASDVDGLAAPIVKTPDDPVGAIAVSETTDETDGRPLADEGPGLVVSASRSVENSMGE